MPAIGPDTVRGAAATGLKGIEIAAGGVLLLDRAAVVTACSETGVALLGEPVVDAAGFFLVAGEASGDRGLGAALIRGLREVSGRELETFPPRYRRPADGGPRG